MLKLLFCIALLAVNIATFIVILIDKRAARRGGNRLPERIILLLTLFLGGIGVLAAFYMARHKTRHYVLLTMVWIITAVEMAAVIWYLFS